MSEDTGIGWFWSNIIMLLIGVIVLYLLIRFGAKIWKLITALLLGS